MGRTELHFFDAATGTPKPDVFDETRVFASNRGLGSNDVVLEHGASRAFEPNGVALAGHFLSMNVGPSPLEIDLKHGRTFKRRLLPPGTFFVQPAAVPMVQRNVGYVRWAALEILPACAQRILGRDLEMRPDCGFADDELANLMRSLVRELSAGEPSGPLYSDALVTAFTARLARVLGMTDVGTPRAPLGAARLDAVRARIEDGIAERLTVSDLAAFAGVSVAHFSREFKRATGLSPHAFVMQRRLERARQLLGAGLSIVEAAAQAGFSD